MTNADKIRQMPDEELAKYFFDGICSVVPLDICEKYTPQNGLCEQCVRDWLGREVNDG